MANYVGFLAPKLALFSNIVLMVAVLLWRPQGLYPVATDDAPSALADARDRLLSARPAAQPLARDCRASLLAIVLSASARSTPFLFPGTQGARTSPPRSSSSSCWSRATTCCSATPASSPSRTRCSSASAPTASRSRSTRIGPELGARSRSASLAALALSARARRSLIGLFCLRVRAIFFAMITLAVASAFLILASQLSGSPAARTASPSRCPRRCSPGTEYLDEPVLGVVDQRPPAHLLPAVRRRARARPGAAAHRQLAVRPRAAGDPRERVPRRGDRLPHRRLPHARDVLVGAVRGARRRAARALAALQRARHDAVVRDHARHAADRRDRRHGHDLRRGRSAACCWCSRRTTCRT